eukprot:1153869-Pelagomonas_calceolata.AAC.2
MLPECPLGAGTSRATKKKEREDYASQRKAACINEGSQTSKLARVSPKKNSCYKHEMVPTVSFELAHQDTTPNLRPAPLFHAGGRTLTYCTQDGEQGSCVPLTKDDPLQVG